ncbi:aminotransferase class V-fold PLP-dependent enzyme [Sphingomonas sp. 35-24ZXX]|uniref:aminotransferase class V-fold PLP-dependent enzyme n=1 Tax=Sphingomonas sp. 35-24ZXX TaxID=1545915 RepID=UPI000691B38A|nr:aminotransferase class V-fold PLP-dependent enzyme [Sphingomonas sp. 35-24ZXX]
MNRMTRRQYLAASAAAAVAVPLVPQRLDAQAAIATLSDPQQFDTGGLIYLDSGSQHPLPKVARKAGDDYLARRALDPAVPSPRPDDDLVRAKFARLINADADEIAFVPSTSAAEQMVLRALGLPERGAHIVSDTLHFFGSFPIYGEMARQGCEVSWVRAVDGRIRIEHVEAAVRKGTRLVALSLVSTYNGFAHDLARICEIAHAAGAMVYADIIHAAGCIPLDVRASGVDFAACASYKWLMGDFGLGFLYVRKDRLAGLRRPSAGYYGVQSFTSHVYPLDPPGDAVADYSFAETAMGYFAQGTFSHSTAAILDTSLDLLHAMGPDRIQAQVQPMVQRLKQELPRLGYALASPEEARTPLATFTLANAAERLRAPLAAARIRLTVSRNRFRVTPSVFNSMADIDALIDLLKRPELRNG